MSTPLLVGLDVGTTGIKATLHDDRLGLLRQARRPVATDHPARGRVEQDPEALLRDSAAVVAEVLRGVGAGRVAGIGLDHQGESVLAWDARDGRPLSPLVSWQDQRGASLLEQVDPGVLARSGLPADPYFSAAKLAWLVHEEAAVRAAAAAGRLRLGTLDAFLVDRLGGRFATDLSTASRTQLLALGGRAWDPELLDAFGLRAEWLPELVPTYGDLGTITHASWPGPLPLRAQLVDQQAALAGSGCALPGQVKATYGTGVFVLAHAGTAPPAPGGGLLPTVAWWDGGPEVEYAREGGVFTAGALLEWLAEGLGLAPDVRALCARAASVPDAAGVRVLPALAGLGAPWWRPEARGVVAGLHGGVTGAHVARAALEAIAHRVADVVEALDADGGAAPALRVDGGLSQDDLLVRLQADLLGREVVRTAADTTALGAALLAGVGAGLAGSVADAARDVRTDPGVLPEASAQEQVTSRAAWRAWVAATSSL